MALRLRRGTDAERQLITPAEGELVYTTDTKKIFVGDGTTQGGIDIDTTGGATTLGALTDVNVAPNDGDALIWDNSASEWVAAAVAGGSVTSLSSIQDVSTTAPTDNQVLSWDAADSIWAPRDLDSLADLQDVASTVPIDGQALIWNNANNVWGPGNVQLTLGQITDVSLAGDSTDPLDGEVLTYDGVAGRWEARIPSLSAISDIDNVAPNAPTNGQALIWNSGNNVWGPGDVSLSLGELNDVFVAGDSTDPLDGEVLTYDGVAGRWEARIPFNTIASMTDVNIDTIAEGHILSYDATNSRWENGNIINVSQITADTITGNTNIIGNDIRIGSLTAPNAITTVDTATANLILTTANTSGEIQLSRPVRVGGTNATVPDGFVYTYNDSNDVAAMAIFNAVDGVEGAGMTTFRARGNSTTPTALTVGDAVATFGSAGYNGAGYRRAGGLRVVVDDTPQANRIPARVEIITSNTSGAFEVVSAAKPDIKETEFFGPATLVKFADATARDAAITSPVAGMMVFVTDVAKAQVYTGSAWVDLH